MCLLHPLCQTLENPNGSKKFYKKYRLSGFKVDDKVIVDRIREECFQAIKTYKENYLKSLGDKLIDKTTGPKTYWSIINSLLNEYKIPRIPPLLVADKIIIDCKEKLDYLMTSFWTNVSPSSIIAPYPFLLKSHAQILTLLQYLNNQFRIIFLAV